MKLPKILISRENAWKVKGRLRAFYWVTRSDNQKQFWCACRARCLCRHIKAVLKDLAVMEGWDRVQFFNYNRERQMIRQKRRTVEMTAHGRPFWVVYACEWAREHVPEGARFAEVKRDCHDLQPQPGRREMGRLFDVYSRKDGLFARTPVRRA